MGYQIILKIKEYDEKFRSKRKTIGMDDNELLRNKLSLKGFCLYPRKTEGLLYIQGTVKMLMQNLQIYVDSLVESWKKSKEKEFNEQTPDKEGYREMWLYGWRYSKENSTGETIETLMEQTMEELFFYVITPTPDMLNPKELEKYERKSGFINQIVNELEDSVEVILNTEFLDYYRNKEDAIIEESS